LTSVARSDVFSGNLCHRNRDVHA